MQKCLFKLFPAMFLCLMACEHSDLAANPGNVVPVSTKPLKEVTIKAQLEQPGGATKTALGEDNAVVWNKEDSFNVLGAGDGEEITYAYSTNYGIYSGNNLSNAFDGDTSTYFWSSEAQASGKYVLITLSKAVNLNSFETYSSNSTDYPNPCNELQVSKDNETWETVGTFSNSQTCTFSDINKQNVKYIRIYATSSVKYWLVINKITMGYSDASNINSRFQIEDTADGQTSGDFTGTIPETSASLYAIYPYSSSNTFDGSTISFSLPQTQSYSVDTFANGANPAVGQVSDGTVAFKNVCGVLKLRLKGSDTVTSIEVTDPTTTHSLWGDATMDVSQIGTGSATVTGGSNTITLNCGNGVKLSSSEATPFYIVVPVGSFSEGLEIKINTFNGSATKTATVANTIKRSVIKAMPTISTDKLELSIPEFNIENAAVSDYRANTTATLSSTKDSNYAQSFFDASRTYRPDQPSTKAISFTGTANGSATVTMSENMDMSNPVLNTSVALDSDGAGTYTLRNMVPGKTYYYQVESDGTVLTGGAFTTTGQVRMIAIDNGFNIRDLGGWTGLNGNKVRYEQLYRGGSLGGSDMNGTTSDITDSDREELKRIGIGAQLDLRAATNSGLYTGEDSYHSYSRGATTLSDADFNNTMTDYGAYNRDASVVADVAWIIYELKQGKPVYYNCRQGADRTGTISFIIEGLLGCYGSDTGHQMAMDYELTGFSQANLIDNVSVGTSYRAATEAYSNSSKLFYALLNLPSSVSEVTLTSLQESCYYYLNRYWNNRTESGSSTDTVTLCIDKDDLDWFIKYMLNMSDSDYSAFKPSWAFTGGTLKTIAEAKNNVVNYK